MKVETRWICGGNRLEVRVDFDKTRPTAPVYAGTARGFLSKLPGLAAELEAKEIVRILRVAQDENDRDEEAKRTAARYARGELREEPWIDDDGKMVRPAAGVAHG